jgi:LacI family transcriptional regulator
VPLNLRLASIFFICVFLFPSPSPLPHFPIFFPKFEQRIARMKAKKEVTIYDLAQQLGLSTATVSRALQNNPVINKNTRKRVQEAARSLGYRQNTFASNLRKQNSNTIGVILHELNSNFVTSVLAGIEKITTAAGYDLIIAHSSESFTKEAANVMNLFHKRVDGIIASLAFDTEGLDHYQPFFDKHIPVVFFDRVEESSDHTKVVIDNYKNGYQATTHLIDQGCKRIAMVTANLNRNVYAQRLKGYRDALLDRKLPYNEKLVLVNDLSEKGAMDAARQIMAMKPMPDGAFITGDFAAAICMICFKQKGIRIPEDIAVVGFNNDAISKIVEPQLTTINYPGMDVGEIAARHLIGQLKGESSTTQTNTIIVKSELIIRQSSLRKPGV